jgi:hypothetical protein
MRSIVIISVLLCSAGAAEAQKVPSPPGSGTVETPVAEQNSCPAVTFTEAEYKTCIADRTSCSEDLKALLDSGECAGPTTDRLKGTPTPTTPPRATPPKYKYMEEWRDVPVGHKVCENGGKVLVKGRDRNKNGKLDDKEITDRDYACKGADGTSGPPSRDGFSTEIDDVLPGTECPDGGLRIEQGLDADRSGSLDGDEVVKSRTRCIRDGRDGKPGASAEAGGKGDDGKNGRDGLDGTTVGLGLLYTADYVTSATEPRTFSSGVGLDLRVRHRRWEASLAAAWSPGVDRGSILRSNLTYFVWDRIGFTGGVKLIYAGMNDKDEANSRFVIGEAGATFRFLDKGHLKGQAELHVGYGGAGVDLAPTTSAGGSASLVWEF